MRRPRIDFAMDGWYQLNSSPEAMLQSGRTTVLPSGSLRWHLRTAH
jgi:hypothetical protein